MVSPLRGDEFKVSVTGLPAGHSHSEPLAKNDCVRRTAVSGQPDFCPLSASEHTPFIQPAVKQRPLFAFGNTVCLLSAAILYNSL